MATRRARRSPRSTVATSRRPSGISAHRNEVERMRQQMPTLDAKLLDSPRGALRHAGAPGARARAGRRGRQAPPDGDGRAPGARPASNEPDLPPCATPTARSIMELLSSCWRTGMTPEQFESAVRNDVRRRQVLRACAAARSRSTGPGRGGARRLLRAARSAGGALRAAKTSRQGQPDRCRARGLLQGPHGAQFQAPEQASIEYVVLDLEALKKGITVTEDELKTYYEQNAARFGQPEERRASHILDQGRPRRAAAERARRPRPRPRNCWPRCARARTRSPSSRRRTRRIRARPPRAAISTSSAAARWSSPSRTRCSR